MTHATHHPPNWFWALLALSCAGCLLLGRLWDRVDGVRPLGAEERGVTARGDLDADEKAVIELFRRTSPSVVHITSLAMRRDFFSRNMMQIPEGTGSGIVWDDQGRVITNFHVIQNADAAQVTLADQSTWEAHVVGLAPDSDIAVLKIDAPKDQLHPVAIGTSDDLLVGQKAFAIGNPFGLDQSLTTGVISALGREIESVTRRPISGVIQTDAAVNPGNSGGPLFDSAGRVIGVNAAIYSPSGASAGIGFAIPIDTVRRIVNQIIQHGKVIRPGLGIQIAEDSLARRLGLNRGVLVVDVLPDSGAEEAGMRPTRRDSKGRVRLGDVVIDVDGKPVATTNDLYLLMDQYEVGAKVKVGVFRDGKRQELTVKLDAMK